MTTTGRAGRPAGLVAALLAFGTAVALFFPGLALHEGLHLAVVQLVGGHGSLVVRPWHLALVDASLPSLHVQAIPALDLWRQLAVDFFGPALAALLFVLPISRTPVPWLRVALVASACVLGFYALEEAGYLLLDSLFGIEVATFTTPEFNYGAPLAICLAGGLVAGLGSARPA